MFILNWFVIQLKILRNSFQESRKDFLFRDIWHTLIILCGVALLYIFLTSMFHFINARGLPVLDFAFDIHTAVGASCVGGKVNGKNVTIRYILQNGDHVDIIRSKNQKPKQDWLSFVVTNKARTKIKQVLNEEKVRAAAEGKEILLRRLKNWKMLEICLLAGVRER